MSTKVSSADFCVRIPARFLKDAAISADAKALRAVLGAFADGHTGRTYVRPSHPRKAARLGTAAEKRRRNASWFVPAGWPLWAGSEAARGRWARRIFILAQPAVARFERSGQNATYQ